MTRIVQNKMKDNLFLLNESEHFLMSEVKKSDFNSERLYEVNPRYTEIYLNYTRLFSSEKNIEALKRAIFIQWFAVSEPSELTGIGNLDQSEQGENLFQLTKLIATEKIDHEFSLMFLHYHSVSSWYFKSYYDFTEEIQFLSEINNAEYKPNYELDFRGQMGNYWKSL